MMYLTSENLMFHILISIPTFFVLLWLFSKFIKQKTYKFIATFLLTIVMTPFLYLGAVAIFFSILFHEPTRNFDKNSWLLDETKRYEMADNIINKKQLIGKDTNQIKALLGDTPLKYPESANQVTWTYDMGMGGGGLGFLFHSLGVKFKDNRVILVEHYEIKD